MNQTQQRTVAVIGADSPIGLTVIRELGERGVRVFAVGRSEHSIGRYSRHVCNFTVEDRPLADWLPHFTKQHAIGAVLAISEYQLLQLAGLKGKLGDCRVLCPTGAMLDLVLDKQRTLDIAKSLAIDVPSSWQPVAGEQFAARAAGLAFPVAIKWADPNAVSARLGAMGLTLEKVEYASGPEELLHILGRYDRLGCWPLVQTWCPGVGLGQMLHMQDGAATLRFQHRRLREWPPSGGVSSFCASEPLERHRAQMELSERLLAAIGWEGPAMVEYRYDPATGRYWLMEINGRFWGSIPLASHCGAHFAWETYRCGGLGEKGPAAVRLKQRKARFVIPDAKHFVAVLRDRKRALASRLGLAIAFLADFLDPRVRYFVWSWRDPMPMFGDLASIVRQIARKDS